MITKIIDGVTVLEVEEGKTLTNGGAIGTPVWLGVGDSINNWSEIEMPIEEETSLDTLNNKVKELETTIDIMLGGEIVE